MSATDGYRHRQGGGLQGARQEWTAEEITGELHLSKSIKIADSFEMLQ